MARIRSIKPELRTSITVSAWPREVRYFFVLLWGYLDDHGRGVDDELLIASDCFPRDRDITPEKVDAWLELMADSGPLCRYEVDGRAYLHATNWREHQKPSHPTRSKVPPCPECEPSEFSAWREGNPQKSRSRSRKAREALRKTSPAPESAPENEPGTPCESAPGVLVAQQSGSLPLGDATGQDADETAGQTASGNAPEDFANPSGNAPEHFVPELGSKGAREQGSKGGGSAPASDPPPPPSASSSPPQRSADRPTPAPIDDAGFELTDAMRRWAVQTFGAALDVEYETAQFIDHHRGEGKRRPNWATEWQKWMRRSAKWQSERAFKQQPAANVVDIHARQNSAGVDPVTANLMAGLALLEERDNA